ncbi:O-antigen chain-terminating methyltransferase [Desulfocicer vacuolatum DSM 3385]|uniref:O-antigen chain-terminating methyltransferase n=1 Tax=Desulfocicer vacuolatum DSM 3385 TaxID=1121400 RepID=A0A1W2BV40_9BACT|nr:methyltransferase domain-containing protein [Desulfocicer vacuolatum]SMC76604.1 O-antigen chain-terminating methyltransferase [Desulfocicer vacuolatum DSM 3385]
MIEMHTPGVDVCELIKLVNEKTRRLPPLDSTNGKKNVSFSLCPEFEPFSFNDEYFPLPKKNSYHLKEFLNYHGERFIDNAYQSILQRKPDQQGKKTFLTRLEKGELTKTNIIGRLRYSKEGRSHKIPIKGLFIPFLLQLLYQVPVFGIFFRLLTAIINLPTIFRNIQVLENMIFSEQLMLKSAVHSHSNHISKLNRYIKDLHIELDIAISSNTKEIKSIREKVQTIAEDFEKRHKKTVKTQLNQHKDIKRSLSTLSDKITLQLDKSSKTHQQLVNMEYQIDILKASVQNSNEPPNDEQLYPSQKDTEKHIFDNMYSDFQDQFRGSRQEVKRRISFYIPFVQSALAATGKGIVLDIGCGRGEWLELLAKQNINARGLDLNRVMVNRCHEMHLDVIETDAMEYLMKLDNHSVSILTGFHIVEHLPFKTLISLIDESFRVIKPGGIVIFETPNPENIMVGACNFYTDPTHKNPIPPETLEFLIKARGFTKIKTHRINLMKETKYLDDNNMQDINDVLFAMSKEQDYAVIGYKE